MLALLVNTFLHKRVHDLAAQELLSCREHFPDTSGIRRAADWRILLFRRRRPSASSWANFSCLAVSFIAAY